MLRAAQWVGEAFGHGGRALSKGWARLRTDIRKGIIRWHLQEALESIQFHLIIPDLLLLSCACSGVFFWGVWTAGFLLLGLQSTWEQLKLPFFRSQVLLSYTSKHCTCVYRVGNGICFLPTWKVQKLVELQWLKEGNQGSTDTDGYSCEQGPWLLPY